MTYSAVDPTTVRRAHCDGPGCDEDALFESNDEASVPVGWCRLGIGGGYRIFDHIDCGKAWLFALTLEQRVAENGWSVTHTADLPS